MTTVGLLVRLLSVKTILSVKITGLLSVKTLMCKKSLICKNLICKKLFFTDKTFEGAMPLSKDLIYKISFFTDKTSGGAIWLSKDLICKKWRLLTCDREQCGQCRYYDITTVRYSDRPLFRHSIIPYKTIYDPHDPWPMVGPYIAYMTQIHHGWPTNDPFNSYFWPS